VIHIVASKQIGLVFTYLLLLICRPAGLMAQDQPAANAPGLGSTLRATHIIGFEGVSNNANGNLSIQVNALRFQKSDASPAQIPIGSIQDVILGQEDKQIGGTTMALTRTAAPYGGGRLIGLFSHKKYDTVTVEYLDSNGGFHGAIFQLNKGQGQVLGSELEAKGVHVTRLTNEITRRSTEETKK